MTVPGINLSIVAGALSRPPELRELPSGDQLLSLDVTVRPSAGPAETVPVAWLGAPEPARSWATGDEVVVVGRVRRRFFRAGGATASRTEVVATRVVHAGRRATARKAIEAAVTEVAAALDP